MVVVLVLAAWTVAALLLGIVLGKAFHVGGADRAPAVPAAPPDVVPAKRPRAADQPDDVPQPV